MARLLRIAGVLVAAVVTVASVQAAGAARAARGARLARHLAPMLQPIFNSSFPARNGIVTNEYAHWNLRHSDAIPSSVWDMTSGSLFAKAGVGWSGIPDGVSPDARSATHTDSAVFRLNTRRADFGDARVSVDLDLLRLVTTPRTPSQDYDGLHIWLRYQSEYNLYVATVARRDGTVMFKRKDVGGPSNGGSYVQIGPSIRLPFVGARWFSASAQARNTPAGVELSLWLNGRLVERVTDADPLAIRAPGAVGIRGDNAEFYFKNFRVDPATTN